MRCSAHTVGLSDFLSSFIVGVCPWTSRRVPPLHGTTPAGSPPQRAFHLILTHANWLNLIECWFSIQVRAASFTSPQQLREALDKFIRKYNQAAVPLAWTKEGGALGSPKTSLGAFCAIKY